MFPDDETQEDYDESTKQHSIYIVHILIFSIPYFVRIFEVTIKPCLIDLLVEYCSIRNVKKYHFMLYKVANILYAVN